MIRKIFEWYAAFLTLSWGGGSGWTALHSYPQAKRYFKEHDRPRSKRWLDNQRPLHNTRATHYRIEEVDGGEAYDLVLYDTTLVRYKANGVTLVRGWDSQTARWFVWSHLMGELFPLSPRTNGDWTAPNGVIVPDGWSAVLERVELFNPHSPYNKLTSAHRPMYRLVSSDGDRQRRADLKARHGTLLDTLTLRMQSLEHSIIVGSWGWGTVRRNLSHAEESALTAYFNGDENADPGTALVKLTESCFKVLLRAASRAEGDAWVKAEQEKMQKRGAPVEAEWSLRAKYPRQRCRNIDLQKPVKQKDLRAMLTTYLVKFSEGDRRSKTVEVKQFPEKWQFKYVWDPK